MTVRLGKGQGYLLPRLTGFSRGCRCSSGAPSLPVAFLGPVVWHTTDPPVLQNAAALMHPFVAFELLHFALTNLKIWAKLRPVPEGFGNTAWGELALTVVPRRLLRSFPLWWINLTTFAPFASFAPLDSFPRTRV